jgi:hypothetical protein
MAIEQNGKTFTLKGLAPNATYIVEVLAVPKDGKPSAWSKPIKFNTNGKDVAPPAITNLVAAFDGNGFNATWDGSAAKAEKDFSAFSVTITSSDFPLITKTYGTTSESFSLSYDDNLYLFGNTATSITISVRSLDRSGNLSDAVSATAENAAPAAPANVSVIAEPLGYSVSWDKPSESDYAFSNIYEASTVSGTYTVVASSSSIPSSVKTTTFTERFVKVSHVDWFGNESDLAPEVGISVTPIQPVSVDTTPPDQRTSISYTPGVGSMIVSWSNPSSTVNQDLAGITVRYAKTASPTNYTWVDIPFTYTSPLTTATVNGLLPLTSYDFSISTFDKTQNRTSYSTASTQVTLGDTTPPPRPKAPTVTAGSSAGGPMLVIISQESIEYGTSTALPLDIADVKVFMLDSGYNTAPGTGISTNTNASEIGMFSAGYNGGTNQEKFYVPLEQNEQRYFYTRITDTSGNISDASPAVQSSAMTVFDSAYISSLTADKIATGTLTAGRYIDVGPSSSTRIRIENVSGGVGKIFSGTGTYNNSDTGFYFDSDGKFSLKDRLSWNPSGIDPITGASTGLLTIKGSIEAQAGSFTGNIKVASPGSIFVGNSASSGARVVMNSTGIAFFDSTSTNDNTGVKLLFNTATGALTINGYIAVGGAEGDITTISGNKVRTGNIESSAPTEFVWGNNINNPDGKNIFATQGMRISLSDGQIISKNFRINSSGSTFLTGQVTSTGLIVQGGTAEYSYSRYVNGSQQSIIAPQTYYSLLSNDGKDLFFISSGGDPAKLRWIDSSNRQRGTVGWEVSAEQGGDATYSNTMVLRANAIDNAPSADTPGNVLIHAQGVGGIIDLRTGTNGVVRINGDQIETPTTIKNRYTNGMGAQSQSNKITYGTGTAPTTNPNPQPGDVHLRY